VTCVSVTAVPVTVHIVDVRLLKLTVRFEVAVALTVKEVILAVLSESVPKLMVWSDLGRFVKLQLTGLAPEAVATT
jgi:hypothetical protein